jgi:AcrR family transcriptional regulator
MGSTSYHHGDLKNALIKAGLEVLSSQGVRGLSLRKVARQAGVSHSAPYAHFSDKQALIGAISTEGFKQMYTQIEAVKAAYLQSPPHLLVETGWTYVNFGLANRDCYKLMFSSVLEKERDYPDFVQISKKNYQQLIEVVEICQRTGVLKPGPPELAATSLWGTVHGLVMLLLEGQISHTLLSRYGPREMLLYSMKQMTLVPLPT